jgi:spermidine synthase
LPLLFALTMFIGAALLFVVQPMIGKMFLPFLGGTPAVWTTCMLFFQAALLAGYAYAHASTSRLGNRRQISLHIGLLLLPFFFLPLGISQKWVGRPPQGVSPSLWLLGLLIGMVGLPFFAVSTTAPLLQRWFSMTDHPSAHDPYFLYSASNVGSMLALIGYPLLLEPNLSLARQGAYWAAGYGLLVVLILACATTIWRTPQVVAHTPTSSTDSAESKSPGVKEWLRWVALAFVPSSLMLSVTTYMTTDLAPVPLLWVVPLAIYLLTFILVFARRSPIPHRLMVRLLPMSVVLLTLIFSLKTSQAIFIPVHLLNLFVVAMVCHGELMQHRPVARHLTAFYLAMSLGGVLGGIFNALVAPQIFSWVAEYPIALVLSCLACPSVSPISRKPKSAALDLVLPLILGVLLIWLVPVLVPRSTSQSDATGPKVAFGVAAFICYTFKGRPARFALGIGVVLLSSQLLVNLEGKVLYQERSFFGVLRVTEDAGGNFRQLIHGRTLHGMQSLEPNRRSEPLSYYHRTGPIGQVFEALATRDRMPNVAVVGLGAGTLASYATPEQRWTFYEIDPAVIKIARDPRYFSFLEDCRARSCDVVLGDARLRLREARNASYGLIVLDAFSSDAIPMHLLTREAFQVYRQKLADGGLIAFHISNRYIDLAPVLSKLASDAGLIHRVRSDLEATAEQVRNGKSPSIWVIVASHEDDLGPLAKDARWKESSSRSDESVWTDDYSNLARHLYFRMK